MAEKEKGDFFERVWEVVAMIPEGKVTSYGHIARHLGAASSARVVGYAMRAAGGAGLPCHRVVNRFGGLSGAQAFGGPGIMHDLLANESVEFDEDGNVNMEMHCWDPAER